MWVFYKIVMASFSASIENHVLKISNLIALRTRIETYLPAIYSSFLQLIIKFGISSVNLLWSHILFTIKMSLSCSLRKSNISICLFLQLFMLVWVILRKEVLKPSLKKYFRWSLKLFRFFWNYLINTVKLVLM